MIKYSTTTVFDVKRLLLKHINIMSKRTQVNNSMQLTLDKTKKDTLNWENTNQGLNLSWINVMINRTVTSRKKNTIS